MINKILLALFVVSSKPLLAADLQMGDNPAPLSLPQSQEVRFDCIVKNTLRFNGATSYNSLVRVNKEFNQELTQNLRNKPEWGYFLYLGTIRGIDIAKAGHTRAQLAAELRDVVSERHSEPLNSLISCLRYGPSLEEFIQDELHAIEKDLVDGKAKLKKADPILKNSLRAAIHQIKANDYYFRDVFEAYAHLNDKKYSKLSSYCLDFLKALDENGSKLSIQTKLDEISNLITPAQYTSCTLF